MRVIRIARALTLACLVAASVLPARAQAPAVRLDGGRVADGPSAARLAQLQERAAVTPVRLLVGLRIPSALSAATPRNVLRPAVAKARSAVLARGGSRLRHARAATTLPLVVVEVDAAGLEALAADPDIASLEEDVAAARRLVESVPIVQADQVWAQGYRGTGWAVAVLDDGVDASHAALGGRVVREACFSGHGIAAFSRCPNGATTQVGAGAAAPCAGCSHGTHVAGTAAGSTGVAPEATVIAVQVFSTDDLAYFSDILFAIDHVLTLADTMDIAAVNLSIGSVSEGAGHSVPCDSMSALVFGALANLRAAGIAPVVAAGNSGATKTGLEFPACMSNAVSVGATTDADDVAWFSNTASSLQLLAPGVGIVAAVPGGGTASKDGTSMATPHVAGAWALLRQRLPSASVDSVLSALKTTGLPVHDSATGLSFPRIRIAQAAEALASFTVTPETWTVAAAGGTPSVTLTSSTAGATWSTASDAAWLTVAPTTGSGSATVALTVAATTSILSRTATATIAGRTVTVTQAAGTPNFTIAPSSWTPVAAGQSRAIAVTSSLVDAAWTVTTSQPWLTADRSGGTGSATVVLTAAAHTTSARPRSATATIAGHVVSVTQDGAVPTFTTAPEAVTAPAGGVSILASVSASPDDAAWTASPLVDWLTASPAQGTGSGLVTITVAPRASVTPRVGGVLIAGRLVTVSQDGAAPSFEISPTAIVEAADGGTGLVTVIASVPDASWTTQSGVAWIGVTPSSGVGSGTVSVSIAPHSGREPRSATITVAGRSLLVTQDAHEPTATTNESAWMAPSSGDVHDLTLDVPPDRPAWTAWTDVPWLIVTPRTGDGDAHVSIAALPSSSDGAGLPSSALPLPLPAGAAVVRVTQPHDNGVRIGTVVFVPAAASSSHTRYLAEGATSDFFDTRLALLNPGDADTTATLQFLRAGRPPVEMSVLMPAHTRRTVWPRDVDGLQDAEFSTVVTSSAPIVVDRTMTWNRAGYGAHAETATSGAASRWYFAEGATHSGFSLFYLLQNPGDAPIRVRARFLRASGAPLEKSYDLAPRSRTNIWANVEEFPGGGRALASDEFSAVLESVDDAPFIAERAMYRSTHGLVFDAGHEAMGVPWPSPRWFLAEGRTGPVFDMFLLVANPSDVAAQVRVSYLLDTGTTLERTLVAAANSRTTIWVDQEQFDGVPGRPLADVAVSTTVEALNGVPLVVERAMWWPGDGAAWHEAHDAAGTTQAGTVWAVAEGEVGGASATETYVLIANTSAVAGRARVTVMLEDGSTHARQYDLAPLSRANVALGPDFGDDVNGRRFGVVVEALGVTDDAPAPAIVVERAMYGDAAGVRWAAGTSAVATRVR